jgi:hypothetical protein
MKKSGPGWHQAYWVPSGGASFNADNTCEVNLVFSISAACNPVIGKPPDYCGSPTRLHVRSDAAAIKINGTSQTQLLQTSCRYKKPTDRRCEFCVDEMDCTDEHPDRNVRKQKCCIP